MSINEILFIPPQSFVYLAHHTMHKSVDISSLADYHRLLRQLEIDDFAFLSLFLFLSVCYSLRGVVWDKPDPYHHLWFEKPQTANAGADGATTRDIGLKLEQSVGFQIFNMAISCRHGLYANFFNCRTKTWSFSGVLSLGRPRDLGTD